MRSILDIQREWNAGSLPNADVDDLIEFALGNMPAGEGEKLRDHFAGLAMQALANAFLLEDYEDEDCDGVNEWSHIAVSAYNIADAMMAERQRRGK